MSAEIRLESEGAGDDEAINHAMQELGRAMQGLLLIAQLREILGYLAPELEHTVEELEEARGYYLDRMANLMAASDNKTNTAPYILHALEFADTYRQQKYVYGCLAAGPAVVR